jgi:hypothetical protein
MPSKPKPGGRYICKCECGGNVYGVRQFGRVFSWCDTCTPVVKVNYGALSKKKCKE